MKKYLFPIMIAAMAVLSCGSKEPSEPAVIPPADPTGLRVELVSSTSAQLSWTHGGEGVEGWWVFQTKGNESVSAMPLNQTALPATDRSYLFEGLKKGETYHFGVKAKGPKSGSQIVYSDELLVPGDEPGPGPEPTTYPVTFTADSDAMTAEFKSKSANGEDVLITLAKVSNNQTVQIDRYEIGEEKFRSYTDWIGPYHMKTVAETSQTENLWGFVGGWHASSGGAEGDPTAQTQSIEVFLDGEPFENISETGTEAKVIVHNKVEALNTKLGADKRFAVNEDVTYTFKDSKLYVKVEITALEDVRIGIYYGMQIAGGFCSRFEFKTDKGETKTTTGDFYCPGKVRDMTGFSSNGHSVNAHMFDEGLGTFSKATPSYSALTQYYGASNGKGYYMLIGDKDASSNALILKKDETVYWYGYYEFR